MQDASRGSSGGKRHAWVRDGLVVSEFAFACLLLVGAGLLIRSFVRVLDVDLGFQPERAAALRIDPSFRISGFAQQNAFIDDALHRARSVPGIVAAGLTDVLPLRDDRGWAVSAVGRVYEKGYRPETFVRVVSDGYFEAAGIPLRSGRVFTESDRASSERIVVVNETFARTLWPSQNPLGQSITTDGGRRVVGVVADVRHTALETTSGSEMYLPLRQTGDYAAMQLVVRTALPPVSLAAGIRTALRPIDPSLPVREFVTLPGSGGQGRVAPTVSGADAGRLRCVRLDTRLSGDLRRDFLFGKPTRAGNWNSDGAGRVREGRAGPHPSTDAGVGRRGARF